jgi:hypothetical protein
LHSAFHDAWGVGILCQEGPDKKILLDIFGWADDCSPMNNHAMIFWVHGGARFATTAVAQGVAKRAREEDRLLASYFFSWTGDTERCDPANLIPTIMYKVALFDKDFLCRVARAVDLDRDIRDKDANAQISILLKKSFENATTASRAPLLIVIDAMDACNHLDDPKVSQDIASLLQTLTTLSFRVKIVITSRFTQTIGRVLEKLHAPGHQSLEMPPFVVEERRTQLNIASHVSEADKGMPLIY